MSMRLPAMHTLIQTPVTEKEDFMEKYDVLEMEVIFFEGVDVITLSNNDDLGGEIEGKP